MWPNINEKKDLIPDAKKYENEANKFNKYFQKINNNRGKND
jgi:hypothetical protein